MGENTEKSFIGFHGSVERDIIENFIWLQMKEHYPKARDVKVDLFKVEFSEALSDPYTDTSGSVPDVVSDFVDRMAFNIQVVIEHKRFPK